MNEATKQKRAELSRYIHKEILPESCIQGIVVIGSVANGTASPDSEIDDVVFLNPYELYAVPAESKYQTENGTYHSIDNYVENTIQLDFFMRLDLLKWSQPTHEWPESMCAALSEGWLAFDLNDLI